MRSIVLALLLSFSAAAYADQPSTEVAASTKAKKSSEPVFKKLKLEGIILSDKDQVIGFAKKAGATKAELENDELTIYGESFNQDTFETLLVDNIAGSKIR